MHTNTSQLANRWMCLIGQLKGKLTMTIEYRYVGVGQKPEIADEWLMAENVEKFVLIFLV